MRHIALIAPPWYPVPPRGYGGIELVVDQLARELTARGHRVTLIGSEGSSLGTVVSAPVAWSADLGTGRERLRELSYAARVERILARARPDLIHDHAGFASLLIAARSGLAPVVHTVHGRVTEPQATFLAELEGDAAVVAISDSQRQLASGSLPWFATVHNAVDVEQLMVAPRSQKQEYLICLARVCPDKGQHIAIEVARRLGKRLVLAGKIENSSAGRSYYQDQVAPAIDGDQVVHISNVSGADKARLLARAAALLAPVQWDEPFGLAVTEAMASGTPAISLERGAARELITEGVTGFVVSSVDAMVEAVRRAAVLDSDRCAEVARAQFSPGLMTDRYLNVYEGAPVSRAPVAVALRGTAAFQRLPEEPAAS